MAKDLTVQEVFDAIPLKPKTVIQIVIGQILAGNATLSRELTKDQILVAKYLIHSAVDELI